MSRVLQVLIAGLLLISPACKKEKINNNNNKSVTYTVTTLPGKFTSALNVAVDAAGNIYVTDAATNRIGKISANGSVNYSFSGNGSEGTQDGPPATASFDWPWGLATDAHGNIYVADEVSCRIRKILPDGSVTTIAGSAPGYVDGDISIARFNHPYGVALDASGQIYIADRDNKKIRRISTAGVVSTLASQVVFSDPTALATDRVGNLFVGDFYIIRKISIDGQVSIVGKPGENYYPTGLAVDSRGNVFYVNRLYNSIGMISPSGAVTTIAGGGSVEGGFADGNGNVARFNAPMGLALDTQGNIYVADFGNDKIRKISSK